MKISEFGSDYNFSLSSRSENVFLGRDDVKLFFSGRAALYGLVEWGILNDGWQRIFFPTYYCHEVVEFLRPLPIDIVYYNYNPFINSPIDYELFEDNVVKSVFVNVDYFGFSRISSHLPTSVVIIDDLTHNIGDAFSSTADYCFGSLRKVLPTPCGGFLYSSYNKKLPTAPPNEFAEGISMMRLTAMYLKTHYLNGDAVDKNLFRRFFLESEARFSDSRTFAEIPASSLAILPFIDVESILKAKRRNLRFILEALDVVEGVDWKFSCSDSSLGLLFIFDSPEMKNSLRQYLINSRIYPVTYWPNQIREVDNQWSNQMLFIHVDFRYDYEDMKYLSDQINKFFNSYDANN